MTASVQQQGTASVQQQGTASVQQQEIAAVTPMRHKGLLGWRYNSRCNYMITLVTEPRQPIFGVLREWGVERSDAGRAAYDAWQLIERRYPTVRATYNSIMPDHFHGIIFITVDGGVSLKEVVAFFAAEVERRIGRRIWCGLWRDSICLAKGQLHRQINYVLSNAKRRWIKEHNPGLFRKVMGFRHWRLDLANETLANVPEADAWDFRAFSFGCGSGERELWDVETGEEVVKPRKANRVQRAFDVRQQAYNSKGEGKTASVQQQVSNGKGPSCCSTLAVSPPGAGSSCCRTLAVSSPGAGSSCCRTLAVTPRRVEWTAMGNPFLLDAPLLVSVRISTKAPPEAVDDLAAKIIAKAERGAVVVSPWISPGEKAVKRGVAECGGRIVQLLPEGMGWYYKPGGLDFDRCAEGRMLVLSPFAPRQGGDARESYGKPRFEWLNLAARAMGDLAIGISREQVAGAR